MQSARAANGQDIRANSNWLVDAMNAVLKGLRRQESYIMTRHELSALSDRNLRDMGLSRSMIDDIARQSVSRS